MPHRSKAGGQRKARRHEAKQRRSRRAGVAVRRAGKIANVITGQRAAQRLGGKIRRRTRRKK